MVNTLLLTQQKKMVNAIICRIFFSPELTMFGTTIYTIHEKGNINSLLKIHNKNFLNTVRGTIS